MYIEPITSDVSQNKTNFQSKKCLTKAKNFLNKELHVTYEPKPQQWYGSVLSEYWKNNCKIPLKIRIKDFFGRCERLMQGRFSITLK